MKMKQMIKGILFALVLGLLPALSEGTLYFEKPLDFKPTIEASGCFVQYEDKILLLHRQDHKPEGNSWGAPGGKLDPYETPKDAVIRETYEETGLLIEGDEVEYVCDVYYRNEKSDVLFHLFRGNILQNPEEVKISFEEHKGFTWVKPEDALQMNLMDGEDQIIEKVYLQ